MLLVVALDSGFIGVTTINDDRLGEPVTADRSREKAPGGLLIPLLHEQKGNGLARLV
jgi:hypothetical protein